MLATAEGREQVLVLVLVLMPSMAPWLSMLQLPLWHQHRRLPVTRRVPSPDVAARDQRLRPTRALFTAYIQDSAVTSSFTFLCVCGARQSRGHTSRPTHWQLPAPPANAAAPTLHARRHGIPAGRRRKPGKGRHWRHIVQNGHH